MCCLLEELSKYKQIRKCNVASFEKEKNQLRKCDVASCKKMQLRKCNFGSCIFSHSPLHLFWCRCIFVCIFYVFFRKNNTKVDQNCKKMQRRKCNVASWKLHFFCIFRSGWTVYVCIVFSFSPPICLSLHPTDQPFIVTLPITPTSFNPLRFPCLLTPLHPFVR